MAMRPVTTTQLTVLNTTLITKYLDAFESAPIIYPEVCSEVESDSTTNTYPIEAAFPEMREWVGEREVNELAAHSFILTNKHMELTMAVDRDAIADYAWGAALIRAGGLGMRSKQAPDKMLTTILQSGDTLLSYDGKGFFAIDHYIDVKKKTGAQRNYFPAGSNMPLTPANWEAVRGLMNGYQDDKGVPIEVEPNICMVPAQLRGVADRIFNAEKDVYGADNVNYKTAKVVVNRRLNGDPTTWYALDTSAAFRPFIFQKREWPCKLVMRTEVTSDNVFRHNRIEYGVDGRFIVGTGAWFRAFKAMV